MDRPRSDGGLRSATIDQEKLLQRILQARPWATPQDVARMAPMLAGIPPKELEARMTRARQRQVRRR